MVIIRNNKKITLTEEELEMAYREQKYNYLLADAECQFEDFVHCRFNGDEEKFASVFGFTAEDVCDADSAYYLLPKFVAAYEKDHDCNNAENDMWQEIIRMVLIENAANVTIQYSAEFALWDTSNPASWRKITTLYLAFETKEEMQEDVLRRITAAVERDGVRNGAICVSTTVKQIRTVGPSDLDIREKTCLFAARSYYATVTDGKLEFVENPVL